MRAHALKIAVALAVVAGVVVALLALRFDWGVWTVYGGVVLAGVLIAWGVSRPILGRHARAREPEPARQGIRF